MSFIFNIFGILIWYPLPAARQLPLDAARWMGKMTMAVKWFPIAYIAVAFFFIPLLLLGLSTMVQQTGVTMVFGWILVVAIVLMSIYIGYWSKFKGGSEKVSAYLKARREMNAQAMLAAVEKEKDVEMAETNVDASNQV